MSSVFTDTPVLTISSRDIKIFTAKGHTSLKVAVKLIILSDNTRVVPTQELTSQKGTYCAFSLAKGKDSVQQDSCLPVIRAITERKDFD